MTETFTIRIQNTRNSVSYGESLPGKYHERGKPSHAFPEQETFILFLVQLIFIGIPEEPMNIQLFTRNQAGGYGRPFDGEAHKEGRHLWEVRNALWCFPSQDDQEDRSFTEEEVPLSILREDGGPAIRRWDLDLSEVPEGDGGRRLHTDYPDSHQCPRRSQAPSRGTEVN
jgi:hypothetical protein